MQNVLNLNHFEFETIHLDFKMSCFKEKQLFQVWNRLFPLEVVLNLKQNVLLLEQRCFLLETFPQWFRAAYSALENSSFALVSVGVSNLNQNEFQALCTPPIFISTVYASYITVLKPHFFLSLFSGLLGKGQENLARGRIAS